MVIFLWSPPPPLILARPPSLITQPTMFQEAEWDCLPSLVPSIWPEHGNVEFRDFELRYREGLDLVLKGINFSVRGGEKVSIIFGYATRHPSIKEIMRRGYIIANVV